MTADEPVAGVPRLCARRADCTRPRGHDDECGPDRADTELADLRAEVNRLEGARALLLQTLDGALGHLDSVALALGLDLPEDDAAFRSDIVADCLLDHAHGVVKRAEKAEAERDALQRRVDAVRALAESLKWVRPDKPCDNAEACCGGPSACDAMYPSVKSVGAETILAALDAVEPADQPHPTPEADCGHPNHGAPDHDCAPFAPEAGS